VLFKYGFGDMVDILKVEQYLELGAPLDEIFQPVSTIQGFYYSSRRG